MTPPEENQLDDLGCLKEDSSNIQPGVVASTLTFITSFLNKPWQTAIPLVKFKNRLQVIAYVFLYFGLVLPLFSFMGSDVVLNLEITGFFSFALWTSAIIAAVTFALGVSRKIPKIASGIVLGIFLILFVSVCWDLYSLYDEMRSVCGRQCGNMIKSMLNQFGIGDQIAESVSAGLYFLAAALIMLIPATLSEKVGINKALVGKLKEINATETNSHRYTNDDISAMTLSIKQTSTRVISEGVLKFNQAKENGLTNANVAEQSILSKPIVKKALIVGSIILVIWFVWPSNVTAPNNSTVERLLKNDAEYLRLKQMASFASILGTGSSLSLAVHDVENCEKYTFDDDDAGVTCSVNYTVVTLGEKNNITEKMIFFKHPRNDWEYHGVL